MLGLNRPIMIAVDQTKTLEQRRNLPISNYVAYRATGATAGVSGASYTVAELQLMVAQLMWKQLSIIKRWMDYIWGE